MQVRVCGWLAPASAVVFLPFSPTFSAVGKNPRAPPRAPFPRCLIIFDILKLFVLVLPHDILLLHTLLFGGVSLHARTRLTCFIHELWLHE